MNYTKEEFFKFLILKRIPWTRREKVYNSSFIKFCITDSRTLEVASEHDELIDKFEISFKGNFIYLPVRNFVLQIKITDGPIEPLKVYTFNFEKVSVD